MSGQAGTPVGHVDEIPVGEGRTYALGGEQVAVFAREFTSASELAEAVQGAI